MEEQWKIIPGIRACYEVSSQGRIRGFGRNRETTISYVVKHNKLHVILRTGYRKQLYWRSVARLVLNAFAPTEHSERKAIRHHNDDITDCRLENIAWGGSRQPLAKLTEEDVRTIRRRWMDGEDYAALAAVFNVHKHTIGRIINRYGWAHVA